MANPVLKNGKVIWKSTIFPEMVFTDTMLNVFKRAYPNIGQFQPQLLIAEAWLVSNPDRVPEKRWSGFINNWMRIANQIAVENKNKTPGSYNEPRHRSGENKKEVMSLGQILNKAQVHNSQTKAPPETRSNDHSDNTVTPRDTGTITNSSTAPGFPTQSGRGLFDNQGIAE